MLSTHNKKLAIYITVDLLCFEECHYYNLIDVILSKRTLMLPEYSLKIQWEKLTFPHQYVWFQYKTVDIWSTFSHYCTGAKHGGYENFEYKCCEGKTFW